MSIFLEALSPNMKLWDNGNDRMEERIIASFSHEVSLLSAVSFLALPAVVFFSVIRSSRKDKQPSSPATTNASTSRHCRNNWTKSQVTLTALLFTLACELPILLSTPNEGLADLVRGRDPLLDEILARVPAIQQGPAPPFLLRNRHVQFIPWLLQNEIQKVMAIPFQRIDVTVSDCADKMMEECHGHSRRMIDMVTLDVFPPFDDTDDQYRDFNKSSPVILFLPGLRGHSQDLPGTSIVRKAYGRGFRSIVVNRRGHVRNQDYTTQKLKSPRWNIFGDVDDLEQVYWHVKNHLVTPNTAIFLHGISTGTALAFSALSKWDKRRSEGNYDAPTFVASVSVTPGYDIARGGNRDRFLWPYNDILVGKTIEHFVTLNEELLRSHDNDAVEKILAASSLQELVDASVAFAGYDNATLYYEDTNPINEVGYITTPKLILNALDDPCCAIDNLYERSPYPRHGGKSYAEMIRETKHVMVAVTYTGSHCPFLCSRNLWLPFAKDPLTGGYMLNSWADQVAIEYFQAALDVHGNRRLL